MKQPQVRCNNCMNIYADPVPGNVELYTPVPLPELVHNPDTDDEAVWICPECKTDEYLMDLDGWIETDPDCNQVGRRLDERLFEFAEDRICNPETKETYRHHDTVNLDDYTPEEMLKYCKSFGYKAEDVRALLNSHDGAWLVAECIFETE